MKGLEGMSYEEQLRTLLLSSLEEGMLTGDLISSQLSEEGKVEREVQSSPWYPVVMWEWFKAALGEI